MEPQEEVDENPVSPVDLSIFKESLEQNLITILDLLPNQEKSLIIEESCITKFGFFIKTDFLTQRQFTKKIFLLQNSPPDTQSPVLLYIIPPKKECLEMIEKHIKDNFDKTSMISYLNNKDNKKKGKKKEKEKEDEIKEIKKEFHIVFIPKIVNECNKFIKESNFNSFYRIYNLNMDIFPLDYDLMSLENESAFYDLFISQNLNSLSILARAIIKYENIFGKIKYKYYLGDLAKKLHNLLIKEEEISPSIDKANEPGTFSCFIFDRSVDMLTPLCSNFIYEGLLDEFFGINLNTVKVPVQILGKKPIDKNNKNEEIKLDLSKNEKFYTQIKDYNFNKIKLFLGNRLKEHNKMLEESKEKNANLKQIQENLLKIRLIKEERPSLINQINLADHISKTKKLPKEQLYLFFEQSLLLGETPSTFLESIDDEMAQKGDLYNIIRMLSLYSLINGGIKNKIFDQIRRDLVNIYGFQEIFFFNNLEKLKILKNYDSSNLFYYDLSKKLKLINDSVDFNNPNDASYSFSGYCPIFIRLIEKAISKGWYSIKDLIKKISNEFEFPNDEEEILNFNKKEKKFILLVFIGGITYGELASIRYLNKVLDDKKFIILTTGMVNCRKIFNALRLGKYKYLSKDEMFFNNGNANNFQIKSDEILTFKDFDEQMNKI
jgi:hypothetical protein